MRATLSLVIAAALVAPVMGRGLDTIWTAALGEPGSPTRTLPFGPVGFETAEGFVVGPLEPQLGWTASGTNDAWSSVSNLGPASGAQHNRQVNRAASAAGTQLVTLGPVVAGQTNDGGVVDVDVRVSNSGGADYDFGAQSPLAGLIVTRVKNYYADSGVYVLDLDPNNALVFNYTGFDYTPGAYYHLQMTVNPVLQQVTYNFNGGAVVYVGDTPTAAYRLEQFYTVHDNFQLAGEYADYDNVSFTPEPAALALLAIGAALARRR